MNILFVIAFLFNTTLYQASAILEYDKKVRLLDVEEELKFKYLFNKTLIDDVKVQILVGSNTIVGATWVDYYSGETQISNVIPIPDGKYTLIGQSVVQRCRTNELILEAFKGVACTCDCKASVVTKEVIKIETLVDWGWTVAGFTVGVGIGVGLGFLLF